MIVVVVDLDGTLLRTDATISTRTKAALAMTRAQGARVVIATGRPPRFTRVLAAEAGLTGVAVCANGAVVLDLGTGDVEVLAALTMPLAAAAAKVVAETMPGVAFAVETGEWAVTGPGWLRRASRETARQEARSLDDLWARDGSCVKLLAWTPAAVTDAVLDRLRRRLPELSVTYSGAAGMVEIAAAGVSKAAAVARLCERWGAVPADVVAFGDMPNDLPVLEWAGTSVAVANAHPLVLERAGRVTASNDDDGVAIVLEEMFAAEPDVVPSA
ncbi:hypothetical protein HDA40_008033 [Hamadaea flava]|uniref:HAD family hydrolase n=1 Tax=Hamadaea flava TaxID=1742688 RepID=A0ABV8LWY0_9ACTN|nr:HAD family hydrolase [Hamadaea flava]MCP2329526.1 hypothetical protein [Hamadaea flava]